MEGDIDRDISFAKNDIDRDISSAENDNDSDISLAKIYIDREGIFEKAKRAFVILDSISSLILNHSVHIISKQIVGISAEAREVL
jgi:hypothetical protein